MKKKILTYLLLPLFLSTSCSNWLDVVPQSDIKTIDSDFETYAGAAEWLRSCYVFLQFPYDPAANVAFFGSDEMVADNYLLNSGHPVGLDIITGKQNVLSPYDDCWLERINDRREDYYTAISLCNHFINRIDNVYNLEEVDKKEWKAEVKALKAFYYFELVRRYGPVIIAPEEIDPNQDVEKLKLPRSHVDTCFNYIVRLCDEAAPDLPVSSKKKSDRRASTTSSAYAMKLLRTFPYPARKKATGVPISTKRLLWHSRRGRWFTRHPTSSTATRTMPILKTRTGNPCSATRKIPRNGSGLPMPPSR